MATSWIKESSSFFSSTNNKSSYITADDEFIYIKNPLSEFTAIEISSDNTIADEQPKNTTNYVINRTRKEKFKESIDMSKFSYTDIMKLSDILLLNDLRKMGIEIEEETDTTKAYTSQNQNFFNTKFKKIYDFGASSFYSIKDKITNIGNSSLSSKFTKTFKLLSNNCKYVGDKLHEELIDINNNLKEFFSHTLNNKLAKIITIAPNKWSEKIIDYISDDRLIKLIENTSFEDAEKITNNIPRKNLSKIFKLLPDQKVEQIINLHTEKEFLQNLKNYIGKECLNKDELISIFETYAAIKYVQLINETPIEKLNEIAITIPTEYLVPIQKILSERINNSDNDSKIGFDTEPLGEIIFTSVE